MLTVGISMQLQWGLFISSSETYLKGCMSKSHGRGPRKRNDGCLFDLFYSTRGRDHGCAALGCAADRNLNFWLRFCQHHYLSLPLPTFDTVAYLV